MTKNHFSALVLAVLILPLLTQTLKAQSEFGAKGGILFSNIKTVNNNSNFEFENKDGLTFGAYYKKRDLLGPVGFQTELLYQMKGANTLMQQFEILPDEGQGSHIEMTGASYRSKEKLNYFSLPILLTIRTTKFLDLYIGPELGYLFSYKTKLQDTGELNRFSMGAAVGASLKLCEKTRLDFRYSTDFTSYNKMGYNGSIDMKNNGFAVTIQQTLFNK